VTNNSAMACLKALF